MHAQDAQGGISSPLSILMDLSDDGLDQGEGAKVERSLDTTDTSSNR